MTSVAESLKLVPLFAELDGRQLKKLAALFRERGFKPGSSVVREGTMSGVGFFVITDGEAVGSVGGEEVTTLSAGGPFREGGRLPGARRPGPGTRRQPPR